MQHIVEREANTLLPQYVGMYRITVYDTETYAVVMRNIFSGRLEIHKKYDLKVTVGYVNFTSFSPPGFHSVSRSVK